MSRGLSPQPPAAGAVPVEQSQSALKAKRKRKRKPNKKKEEGEDLPTPQAEPAREVTGTLQALTGHVGPGSSLVVGNLEEFGIAAQCMEVPSASSASPSAARPLDGQVGGAPLSGFCGAYNQHYEELGKLSAKALKAKLRGKGKEAKGTKQELIKQLLTLFIRDEGAS